MRTFAPSMRILDGDGHTLVPGFVIRLSARVAAHTMVIVDGEKHMHTRAHTRTHMHIDIQVIVDGEKHMHTSAVARTHARTCI